jgi:hypothetical protein
MERLQRQLMPSTILVIILTILILPGRIAQAATPPMKPSQLKPQSVIQGTTSSGINAISCEGTVWYAYLGTDNHLNVVSINNNPPIPDTPTTFTDTSNVNPSITCWNNTLWIAFTDSHTAAIHIGEVTYANCPLGGLAGDCVLANGNVIPGQSTYGTPALGALNGVLYVAWKGTTSGAMTVEESTTGASWFSPTVINGNTTSAEPSLVNNGSLVIVWAGTDRPAHINFAAYHDGNANLSNKVVASDTTKAATGEAAIGVSFQYSRLHFAFEGSDNTNQIVTGSWAASTGYISNDRLAGAYTHNCPGLAGLDVFFTGTNSQINEVQMPG